MVARITKRQQYARHQVIIKASERGTAFFLLTQGVVRVSVEGSHGQEVSLGALYPHDFFGEMAILDGQPRSATVTAIEETEVLVIAREDFLECIRKVPQIATKMIVTLSLRLRRTDQKVGILALFKAPRRVARTLLDLVHAQGRQTPDGIAVDPLFTRRELAELAGVSREMFARLLSKFQRMGVLTAERRKLLIADIRKLEDLT